MIKWYFPEQNMYPQWKCDMVTLEESPSLSIIKSDPLGTTKIDGKFKSNSLVSNGEVISFWTKVMDGEKYQLIITLVTLTFSTVNLYSLFSFCEIIRQTHIQCIDHLYKMKLSVSSTRTQTQPDSFPHFIHNYLVSPSLTSLHVISWLQVFSKQSDLATISTRHSHRPCHTLKSIVLCLAVSCHFSAATRLHPILPQSSDPVWTAAAVHHTIHFRSSVPDRTDASLLHLHLPSSVQAEPIITPHLIHISSSYSSISRTTPGGFPILHTASPPFHIW